LSSWNLPQSLKDSKKRSNLNRSAYIPDEAVEKVSKKVIPAKAGIYSNMLIFLSEWMPARLWRIYDLRGQDFNV